MHIHNDALSKILEAGPPGVIFELLNLDTNFVHLLLTLGFLCLQLLPQLVQFMIPTLKNVHMSLIVTV